MYSVKKLAARMRKSLNTRLIFISIAIAVFVETGFCVILFGGIREISIYNTSSRFQQALEQLGDKLNEKFAYTIEQFNELEINEKFVEVAGNKGNRDYISDFIMLSEIFESVRKANLNVIDSIAYLREDGTLFCETPLNSPSGASYSHTEWYQQCQNSNGYIAWISGYSPVYFKYSEKTVIGMMKTLPKEKGGGILIFNLRKSYIEQELNSLSIDAAGEFYLADNSNGFVTLVNDEKLCRAVLEETVSGQSLSVYKRKNNMIFTVFIPVNGWRINAIIPKNSLFQGGSLVVVSMLAIILGGATLLVFLLFFTMRNITKPLNDMEMVIDSVDRQRNNIRIPERIAKREDEIGALANKFNIMLDRIEELIEKVKIKEKIRARTEVSMLQQQINSHFLYNTLESISLKVMNGKKEESFDMIIRLSKYFRLALNQGRDITTVKNELEHIRNYVEIEKYRYKDKFSCNIDVPQELLGVRIPKLLLQPLVENSIIHGFFDIDTEGIINITGRRIEDKVVLIVSDSGVGFPDGFDEYVKNEEMYEEGKNFALRNIYIRIKLFYKDKGDMYLYNNTADGHGACVELVLPIEGEF